jgi:hypothetical protein
LLASNGPPWFDLPFDDSYVEVGDHYNQATPIEKADALTGDAAFVSLVVWATELERPGRKQAQVAQSLVGNANANVACLGRVLQCRFQNIPVNDLKGQFSELSLTEDQERVIVDWIRQKVNFQLP